MNSRVSWSSEGIDPAIRERAEAAARRAGVSLSDWLNLTLGDTTPPDFRKAPDQRPAMPPKESRDVADIHQRLDAITRQIDQISQGHQRNDAQRGEPPVAKQLNDAIARLDARLSQISNPAPARQREVQEKQRQADMVERAATQVYRPSPPLNPGSFDSAIAEISARQNELDNFAAPTLRSAPPIAPAAAYAPPPAPAYAPPPPAPGPDFSSLERHLLNITSQIESLRRPDHIDQSIAAFRSELSEIRHAITEAMPRRAIESIEGEIRSLSRRIDDTRQNGSDDQTLASIERALGEIREVLRSLTPAEQLAGYDQAIRNLTAKLDQILRANDDPSTVHQLEGAIAALRAIVSNIASNDALARLSDDVHALSAKVDQLARADDRSGSLAAIEQRIAALTSSLESRDQRPAANENSEQIERALLALSDRLDRIPVGNDDASAFAHLEQRVSYLLERLEASGDHRSGNLGRVEEGLQDVLQHLERQHASFASLIANNSRSEPLAQQDSGLADLVKRELSDIRFSQAETDRHTQDSLEAVHNTLGHVVDRLSMIEGDLRTARPQPAATPAVAAVAPAIAAPAPSAPEPSYFAAEAPASAPSYAEPEVETRAAMAAPALPELPNPAPAQEHFAAAPRDFHAAAQEPAPPALPRTIGEILEPHTAPSRVAIEPDLPPDHPLEPGTRPSGRAASPSERIAASENAISNIPAGAKKEPVSTSSFIAAARRAAQAAAAAPPPDKAGKQPKKPALAGDQAKTPSTITSKIRSLLVGASVVVIVLGTFKMAMTLLDTGAPPSVPAMESSRDASPPASPGGDSASPAPAQTAPSLISPAPIGRQSFNNLSSDKGDGVASVAIPQNAITPSGSAASDVTGAIPLSQVSGANKLSMIAVPPTERLPDAIGGPVLRAAVLKGDPTAAYEVGVRFAEGKGVAANYDEAAKWFDRAAQAGVVPAIFRLGTFYEKGLSVTKDTDIARRYYVQAAERGNAKAMHNLAVLDADGGGRGADYKSAAQWFRKAADRGIADSQYNLGILYARGIGVDQNLAESFKWFSLAAAQGDADAGRKRDDIAKRLDPQSLAAAKLAIQTFAAEPQPDDAINVTSPAGGWDSAPAPAASTKPAVKPVASKRTAAAAASAVPAH
jgi:localization factor PodJL